MACNTECTPCFCLERHIARHKQGLYPWGRDGVQYARLCAGTNTVIALHAVRRPKATWRAMRYRIKSQHCGRHTKFKDRVFLAGQMHRLSGHQHLMAVQTELQWADAQRRMTESLPVPGRRSSGRPIHGTNLETIRSRNNRARPHDTVIKALPSRLPRSRGDRPCWVMFCICGDCAPPVTRRFRGDDVAKNSRPRAFRGLHRNHHSPVDLALLEVGKNAVDVL